MVASANCVVESATTYFTSDAVPVKDGNGLNVTVQFEFTLYVPSPGTSRELRLQLAFAVKIVAHSFTDVATRFAGAVAASFVRITMI